MNWDKVYAQVNPMQVETAEGPVFDVVSFRMIAEIEGFAYVTTHVMLQKDFDEIQPEINVFGHILNEMIQYIDDQAGAFA